MNPEKLKQLQDQVRIGGKVCYDYVRLFKVPRYTVMFTSDQAKTWYIVRPWCGAGLIVLRLQSTKY